MYDKIEGGKIINIQGLDCCIPPEGYIYNIITKTIEWRGVYERSPNIDEQYWERIPFPSWYSSVLKQWDRYDKTRKEDDPPFYDERLEKYKSQEWDRRLCGFWFRNRGQAVYLTGFHYYYLQYWTLDTGVPKFRMPDLEKAYFMQYCLEDNLCMGFVEVTKRRFGKSYWAGAFIVEYITRTKMTNGGIQSKTGKDAKKFFTKTIVNPFRKLPKFFRPVYDTSLGPNPKSELRFQRPNVRGKKGEEEIGDDELGSLIDFESSDKVAYDGQKEHRYVADEVGKTVEEDVYERHEVVRYTLLDDEGKIIGKALYTTTVEKIESDKNGVQDAFKTLWYKSDQNDKKENGQTETGLYRFFMSAKKTRNIDIYGYPDEEKTLKQILADRASVKNNSRSLNARIRKEPLTIEEAFLDDAEECIFNVNNINERIGILRESPVHKRNILFYRDIDQLVKWRDVDSNKAEIYWNITDTFPLNKESNKYYIGADGRTRMPANPESGTIGVDGYSNTQGGKEYGSKLSGWVYLKYDTSDPFNTGKFCGHIYGRPNEKEDLYEQILLCGEYLGFLIYWEFVADDYYNYFKHRGRLGYLALFPKIAIDPIKLKKESTERHRGFPTTEFALAKQNDTMISYVEHHCERIDYLELLEDLLKYRTKKRTPSDRTVSAMITLVGSLEPIYKPPPRQTPLITVYENPNYGNIPNNGIISKN